MKNDNVNKLVKTSVLCSLSVVLVWLIHFPIIPGVTFLEYDPADICLLIAGLSYGTWWGICATAIVSVIQGITVSIESGWIGIIMHFIATGTFVAVSSVIYKKTGKLAVSLALGAVSMVIVMIPLNLIFTGIFMHAGVQTVAGMLIPAIIPFNIAKSAINAVICGLIFKRCEKYFAEK